MIAFDLLELFLELVHELSVLVSEVAFRPDELTLI